MAAKVETVDRHAVQVNGQTMVSGPGHLSPDQAAGFVDAYVDANPGDVVVSVHNYTRDAGDSVEVR